MKEQPKKPEKKVEKKPAKQVVKQRPVTASKFSEPKQKVIIPGDRNLQRQMQPKIEKPNVGAPGGM